MLEHKLIEFNTYMGRDPYDGLPPVLEVTLYILSRASEVGSPTNRPGSDKTRGQGSFGPSTGGPDLRGSKLGNHLDTPDSP